MTAPKRILLVDDDVDFTQATRDLLEVHGYTVAVAHDGEAGILEACRERPDLMILDVMMTSDTEGFDVSRRVKDTPELRGLPIILMIGIRRAMNLPFPFEPDGDWLPVKVVLEKPVPPDKLLHEIRNVLEA
jgi:two-component system, OmpR family, alkaline phosphatase synthesis response regulator PhoP